jgi:hypothetical protein
MMAEGDNKGMGNVGEPRYMLGGDYHKTMRPEDLDHFVGGLCRGPLAEGGLLADTGDEGKKRLREYNEQDYLRQLQDDRWRLHMPVLTAEDEDLLIAPIDSICAELANDALDPTLTSFADKIDKLEFSHLLNQPYYLGFIGFQAACSSLMVACREEGLMPDISNPPQRLRLPRLVRGTQIMRSWNKGR